MHPTTIAQRSHSPYASHQLTFSGAPTLVLPFEPADSFEISEDADIAFIEGSMAQAQAPVDDAPKPLDLPEPGAVPYPAHRAGVWAVAKDFARELAGSLREAYATLCRDGFVEATRMLTSQLTQLFVTTSAFFFYNLGRRITALMQRASGRS